MVRLYLRSPCLHRGSWAGLALLVALAVPFIPGIGLAGGGGMALRIESLDVSAAPDFGPPVKPQEPKASWRTSFGSERRSSEALPNTIDPGAFDGDVVLLQGVTAVRAVRRVFPARSWRVVFSRQVLASDDPLDPWSRDAVAERPTTAIAVRYREGLKVTGQEHLLKLAAGDGAGRLQGAAGTAVRVLFQGRTLWLLSASLSEACAAQKGAACPARVALEAWRSEKEAQGEIVIAGGDLASGARTSQPAACARQALERRSAGGDRLEDIVAADRPKKGCVAALDFEP